MSQNLDARLEQSGTRVRLFPQPSFLPGFTQPDIVYVSPSPSGHGGPNPIREGPADDRMEVVDAIDKLPYEPGELPPYDGPRNPPVQPGSDGHFDYLEPGTREFSAVHMYGVVRRVLDIWTDFFQRRIEWHFRARFARLLLIPLIEWDNAQSGYGFLEFGFGRLPFGGIDHTRPYCENFDVLAHELGHSIIFTEVGTPSSFFTRTPDYGGFHESCGDLVAIVASLHFESVVSKLLDHSRGNLFTANELSRVGELSASRQIRVAFNYERMREDVTEPHARSLPLTGAIFDILVEVFLIRLLDGGMINQNLFDRALHVSNAPTNDPQIQADFDQAYTANTAGFRTVLLEARDYLGYLLAKTWTKLSPDNFRYVDVIHALLDADRELNGKYQDTIRSCFAWRNITQFPANSLLGKPIRIDECYMQQPYDAAAALVNPETRVAGLMMATSGRFDGGHAHAGGLVLGLEEISRAGGNGDAARASAMIPPRNVRENITPPAFIDAG